MRTRIAVGGLAVLMAVGGGVAVGWAALPNRVPDNPAATASGPASPTGSPSPSGRSTSPSRPPSSPATAPEPTVEVPAAAMLRPSDAGPRYRVDGTREEGDWSLGFSIALCPAAGDWTHATNVVARRLVFLVDGSRVVIESVNRFAGEQARQSMADHRAVLARCRDFVSRFDGQSRTQLTIVDRDFAGLEALLVRVSGVGYIRYHALVRQGDLFAQVKVDFTGGTEAFARTLARRAAARLCLATPTC